MDAPSLLWERWLACVKEVFVSLHAYQQEVLALIAYGMLLSGTAVLNQVADEIWSHALTGAKATSTQRRLNRFVDNRRIHVATCWQDFLRHVLPLWHHRQMWLVLDVTPFNEHASIVYLGVLIRSRVLPLAWTVMPQQEKWPQGQWSIVQRLIDAVQPHLSDTTCTLMADSGLACLALIRLCEQVGWHYVLRIEADEWVRRQFKNGKFQPWQHLAHLIGKPGQSWYGSVLLWQEHRWPCFLSAQWHPAYQKALLVISDRPASPKRVQEYRWRFRVEATFQDSKSRGFAIEASHLSDLARIERWLLPVCLAIWWVGHLGASGQHHGHRSQIDRTDRRDKGLLVLGRLWFKRLLTEAARDLLTNKGVAVARLANCLLFHRTQVGWRFSISLK